MKSAKYAKPSAGSQTPKHHLPTSPSPLLHLTTQKPKKIHTFFPGFPSTTPSTFSTIPSTLSFSDVFLFLGAAVFFTPAGADVVVVVVVVVFLVVVVRGLVDLRLVVVLAGVMASRMRGREWPVAWRALAMVRNGEGMDRWVDGPVGGWIGEWEDMAGIDREDGC